MPEQPVDGQPGVVHAADFHQAVERRDQDRSRHRARRRDVHGDARAEAPADDDDPARVDIRPRREGVERREAVVEELALAGPALARPVAPVVDAGDRPAPRPATVSDGPRDLLGVAAEVEQRWRGRRAARNEEAGEPRAVARDHLQPFGAGGKVRRAGTGLRKEDEPLLPEPGRGRQADEDCRERDQPLHVSSPSRRPPPPSDDYRDGGGGKLPTMLEISPHERRALRAQAHHLHPVVTIGQHGLTPTVLTEIDLALNAHGLIKVRVFLDDRDEREFAARRDRRRARRRAGAAHRQAVRAVAPAARACRRAGEGAAAEAWQDALGQGARGEPQGNEGPRTSRAARARGAACGRVRRHRHATREASAQTARSRYFCGEIAPRCAQARDRCPATHAITAYAGPWRTPGSVGAQPTPPPHGALGSLAGAGRVNNRDQRRPACRTVPPGPGRAAAFNGSGPDRGRGGRCHPPALPRPHPPPCR